MNLRLLCDSGSAARSPPRSATGCSRANASIFVFLEHPEHGCVSTALQPTAATLPSLHSVRECACEFCVLVSRHSKPSMASQCSQCSKKQSMQTKLPVSPGVPVGAGKRDRQNPCSRKIAGATGPLPSRSHGWQPRCCSWLCTGGPGILQIQLRQTCWAFGCTACLDVIGVPRFGGSISPSCDLAFSAFGLAFAAAAAGVGGRGPLNFAGASGPASFAAPFGGCTVFGPSGGLQRCQSASSCRVLAAN